eukprot:15460152-Alexandrium_andersonii.AAC.1
MGAQGSPSSSNLQAAHSKHAACADAVAGSAAGRQAASQASASAPRLLRWEGCERASRLTRSGTCCCATASPRARPPAERGLTDGHSRGGRPKTSSASLMLTKYEARRA